MSREGLSRSRGSLKLKMAGSTTRRRAFDVSTLSLIIAIIIIHYYNYVLSLLYYMVVRFQKDLKHFNLLVDSIDDLLERADSHLRAAAAGVHREEAEEEEEKPLAPAVAVGRLPKPQVRWRHLTDNQRSLFVPRLLLKHNESWPLCAKVLEAQKRVGLRAGSAAGGPRVEAHERGEMSA